jgi:hypothetical protein
MGYWQSLGEVGHIVAALAIIGYVTKGLLWTRDRSAVLAAILAFGVLVRLIIGLTLFAVSYFQLPVLSALQAGGGFWQLAPDAKSYYEFAVRSVTAGSFDLPPAVPSPFFVKTLAFWMLLLGVSPSAAILLNLCLYVGLTLLIVWIFEPMDRWRDDLPCIVAVGACSFSPAILLYTSQPLKDGMSYTVIAIGCLGVLGLRRIIYGAAHATLGAMWGGAAAMVAAIFVVAGIRWYSALIMWGALATVLGLFAVKGRTTPLPRYLINSVALLVIAWSGVALGSGVYSSSLSTLGKPAVLAKSLEGARKGFLLSGGGTNIAPSLRQPEPGQAGVELLAMPINVSEHFSAVETGFSIIFVPISVVSAVSGIRIPGGRGLLSVVDLDTLFQDVTILAVLMLLWTRRRNVGDRLPLVAFGLVVSVASAIPMAYVVTNFGTLWRLRLLVAVPIWIVAVALHPARGKPFESVTTI